MAREKGRGGADFIDNRDVSRFGPVPERLQPVRAPVLGRLRE